MRIRVFIVLMIAIMTMVACESKERVKAPKKGMPMGAQKSAYADKHTVEVQEVIQAASYTYLRVTEDGKEYWIATAKQPIEAGITLTYGDGLEMKDFTSKELDRVFESIFFVGLMGTSNSTALKGDGVSPHSNKKVSAAKSISVEKVAGSMSIEELYADMSAIDGKVVTVRGEVTKFNSGIMGRNWIHLQDGTSKDNYFDVTITTNVTVKEGDVVMFSGKVALNKDFGAGYIYDLIIEEAEIAAES